MPVTVLIPELGDKFQDYRDDIAGDSYNWGPAINASKVDAFVFHHSVTAQTAKNDGNWKAECDKIAKLHIDGRGWDGIGYRFVICSDGTVAYVGDLSHGGSAVANENDHIFSACFVGDFTKELPTAAQVHSAHVLAKYFQTSMPAYPLINDWNDVRGHKEYNPTSCPSAVWKTSGDNLYTRIVQDNYSGYPNPQPMETTPPTPPVTPPEPPKPPEPSINWEKKYNDLYVEFEAYKVQSEKTIAELQAKIDKAIADLS